MSDIYSSYLSESTQKKENIYASWPKEKNIWGKNTASAPQIPPPRIPPPQIKRDNKPEHVIFKDGYIEQYY